MASAFVLLHLLQVGIHVMMKSLHRMAKTDLHIKGFSEVNQACKAIISLQFTQSGKHKVAICLL